jgi:G3E family GTPase
MSTMTQSPASSPEVFAPAEGIPISVITGFLGSGKTTLLSRLLKHPDMADTAVLINEFGEIGLDHHLVEAVSGEMVVMDSGCLCCTVRGDLAQSLRTLYFRRVRGEIPQFRRVVIETTGLADPAPILQTLMEDPIIESYYRLDTVVTTVDAVNGSAQLDAQFESVKQAAVADRLLLTKSDIATADAIATLEARLRTLNPGAPLFAVSHGEIEPARLFGAGLYNPATKSVDVQNWLRAEAYDAHEHGHDHDHDHDHDHHGHDRGTPDVNRHDDRIRATCLTFDTPIDWEAFSLWMGSLARYRGEDLLRVKGILNVAGEERPVAVHGVQHVFHPPARLPAWPNEDRRSRLVLITRDMDRAFLEESFAKYREAGRVAG